MRRPAPSPTILLRLTFPLVALIAAFISSHATVPVTLAQQNSDNTPPQLSSASVNGVTLTLTFDETLDTASSPAFSDFTINVTDSVTSGQSAASVTNIVISGVTVTLTLDYEVRFADAVTLVYVVGEVPIQDSAGNPASGIGSAESPYSVDNPTAKNPNIQLFLVTFTHTDSGRTYVIPNSTPWEFSVENGDEYLDIDVVLTDPRGRVESIEWFKGRKWRNNGNRVSLPRVGTNSRNRARIIVRSELGNEGIAFPFNIIRKRDTPNPMLNTATVNSATIILTFSESLDQSSIPAGTAFTVTTATSGPPTLTTNTVTNVSLNGASTALTLDTPVRYQETVILAYTQPGANPLKNPDELQVANFANRGVTNNTPSSVNTLSALALSGITLTPVFASATTQYTAGVGANIDQTTVTATPTDTASTVDVSPDDADENTGGHQVDLVEGSNTITITVTPEDTTATVARYTITVTKAAPPDTTPPVLVSSSASSATLTLTYDEDLDEDSTPETSAFVVAVNGQARTVSAVNIIGKKVKLTLDPAAEYGDLLTLAYTVPAGEDAMPVRNRAGLDAPAITVSPVDNDTPDTTPPVLSKSSVNGATLTLTYDEELDGDSTPATGAFTVTVNGNSRTLSSVSVSETDVTLTLSSSAEHGDAVTLAYAVPTGDDSSPIRNRAGLAALAIPAGPVTNETPDTTPPTLSSASVAEGQLTLTYNETLDTGSKPAAADFTVKVTDSLTSDEATATVTDIDLTGKIVTLTLGYQVRFGDTVTLVYTSAANPIRDTSKNNAANIGSTESPYSVANSSPKSHEIGIESVTFSSINSEQTYIVPKTSFGQILTVENEDDQLDVSVSLTDSRAQISSIQWRDKAGNYHSTDLSGGNARVTLPLQGDGLGNYNNVRMEVRSEAGTDLQTYYFNITRKLDTTAPTLSAATANSTMLTLTYGETLDESSTPDANDFTIKVVDSVATAATSTVSIRERRPRPGTEPASSGRIRISNVTVDGVTVALTLAQNVRFEDTVTLNYAKGDNPIEDPAQNPAANLSGQSVTNETIKATTNTLNDLSLSSVTLDPTFASATTNYTATVPHKTGETTITVTPTDSRSTTAIDPTDADDDLTNGHQAALSVGDTTITVTVTPEDATASRKDYTVTVTRQSDTTPPELVSASVNGATLVLSYDEALDDDSTPETGSFTVSVNENARSVSEVSIAGSAVTLTLDPAAEHGDTVTLAYTVPTGENASPIQDIAGNPAPAITTSFPVSNDTPDTTPPGLVSASVNGATLTLTYDESLDGDSSPTDDSFTVTVNENARSVSAVSVAGSGVTLTLKPAAEHGDTVTLAYTVPTGENASPIQDIAGNPAPAITTSFPVSNDTPDTTPPGLVSASVNGATLTLTYDESLDGDSSPTDDSFTVTVNENARSVSAVSVAGSGVTLTLKPAAEHGDTVTLAYTVPTGENASPIQDIAGNPAPAITTSFPVSNDTPDTTPPGLVSASVDGATLTLAYNETLDEDSAPTDDSFTVTVNENSRLVTAVSVAGSKVALTLVSAAEHGDTVTLTYTVPTGENASPIQDIAGNPAPAITTAVPVSNDTPDTTSPGLVSASVNGVTLTLTYGEDLDTESKPAAGDFTISITDSVTSGPQSASVKTVDVAGKTVILTLDYQTRFEDTIALVYTSGVNPIQDASGNKAANIGTLQTPHSVANSTTKSKETGIESVTFQSVISDRTYIVPKISLGTALTVEYTDDQLDVAVSLTDARAQVISIQWRDRAGNFHSTDPSEGDTRVTLPFHGTGLANYNKAKIEVKSESGASHTYTFNIARESDTTAPLLAATTVNGATLTIAYDKALDQDSTPETGAFTVTVSGDARPVLAVSVSETEVALTLDLPIEHGDTVVLTYTVPTGEGARPIRGLDRAIAPAVRSGSVENQTPDTTPPELVSASVNGATLVLSYDEALDEDSTPAAADFTIKVTDKVTDSVTNDQHAASVTAVNVAGETVTLTLGYEVRYADTVTLVYAVGTNPIRDASGNPAAGIGAGETPYPVDNPTKKSTTVGYEAVIFRSVNPDMSINSDRAYEVTESDSSEFTVENEDEYLDVEVVHIDRRGQVDSVEWFDGSADQFNEFKDNGNVVRLQLQGIGQSNWNRVRISLLSESGDESAQYEFQITRKRDTTSPSLTKATVDGATLTLTYNETLNRDSTPAGSDFSVTVIDSVTEVFSTPAVSAVKLKGKYVILTLDAPARFEDRVTLTYTKGTYPIRDATGNVAADLHNETVTNKTLLGTTNTLIRLSITGTTLGPIFDPTYLNYVATVPNEIKQVTVTAIATDPRAKFRITPEDGDGDTAGHQVSLESEYTTISVMVTPENPDAADETYTITVTRLPDTIAPALGTATVNGASLTLTYNEPLDEDSRPEVGDFSVEVVDSVSGNTWSPTVSNIAIDDTAVALNVHPAVRYRDNVTLTYTPGHNPIRDLGTNNARKIDGRSVANSTRRSIVNTLDMLAVDGDVVTLYDHTLEYAFTVDNEVEQATITATAADSRSAVSIIPPDADESKENGHQVMLEVGETTIAIVVTPEDSGALQGNYAIMITRLPDTTAPTLGTATVDGASLTLTYNEPLDEDSTPSAGDFTVEVVDSATGEYVGAYSVRRHDGRHRSCAKCASGGPIPG